MFAASQVFWAPTSFALLSENKARIDVYRSVKKNIKIKSIKIIKKAETNLDI